AQLQADKSRRGRNSARQDCASRRQGRVRALQDEPRFRRHIPQPPVAGLKSTAVLLHFSFTHPWRLPEYVPQCHKHPIPQRRGPVWSAKPIAPSMIARPPTPFSTKASSATSDSWPTVNPSSFPLPTAAKTTRFISTARPPAACCAS